MISVQMQFNQQCCCGDEPAFILYRCMNEKKHKELAPQNRQNHEMYSLCMIEIALDVY